MAKKLVTFKYNDEEMEPFEALKRESGLSTKELLDKALILFQWAIKELKAGRCIGSIDEKNNSFKEVTLPFFANVKRTERK